MTNNTATGNDYGFFVSGGTKHSLSENTAAKNTHFGFATEPGVTATKLVKNLASQNGDEGFAIFESGHTLTQNQAFDNGDGGIKHIGTDSKFQKNTALGNTGFDLSDLTAGCDNNKWKKNLFGSANDPCIK